MLNYSVEDQDFFLVHPLHRTFPASDTMFRWKDEILGPGAARFKIMTQGPATVPSRTAAVAGRGGLLITN